MMKSSLFFAISLSFSCVAYGCGAVLSGGDVVRMNSNLQGEGFVGSNSFGRHGVCEDAKAASLSRSSISLGLSSLPLLPRSQTYPLAFHYQGLWFCL